IWAAGVRANPLAAALGVPVGRSGRIVVGADLRIDGHREAFAVGDIAVIPDGHGGVLPMLAPVAMQSGRYAAAEILRAERRRGAGSAAGAGAPARPSRPFRYLNKGTMATIGRRAAVAELPLRIRLSGTPAWMAWLGLHLVTLIGFRNRLSGTPAWMAWLGLHLVTLIGFRNRLSVLLNWAWNYLTWDRGPRLILRLQ